MRRFKLRRGCLQVHVEFGLWMNNLLEDFNSDIFVISASCDDKCKVNIGEPSLPIQLVQRGKANSVPCGLELVAGDHDFHVCNLTPSVTLLTDIKAHPDGDGELPSLYKGYGILINSDNNITMMWLLIVMLFIFDVSHDLCMCT